MLNDYMEGFIQETEIIISKLGDLKTELSEFRALMKEFKKTVEKRLENLESRQTMCQMNPSSCANARKLEEHIKSDSGKTGRTVGIIACVISCFNVAVAIITLVGRNL